MGAMLLPPLSFAAAETSIYQEVITSSNSGGQIGGGQNNTSTVEVMSTTIINGEEYNYYFSTSTTNAVAHQVTIIDGTPIRSGVPIDTNVTDSEPSAQEYETWLISMINLLNYLQQYVANTF